MVTWEARLREAVGVFDWPQAATLAGEYVQHVRGCAEPPATFEAKGVLQLLRENVRLDEMLRVADALLGQGSQAAVVRRQYAQALVDSDRPWAALMMFEAVLAHADTPASERAEARGGVGRCYKQLFVVTEDSARRLEHLGRAVDAYLEAYDEDDARVWHGINAVALLSRADRDGVSLPLHADAAAEARRLAGRVLERLDSLTEIDAWVLAVACEAHVALDEADHAVRAGNDFVRDRGADAFKIRSLLRQLSEIWQLDPTTPPGDPLLPLLRSALLHQTGGSVRVETVDVRAERSSAQHGRRLEKVLGRERFQSLTWYRAGLSRCRAVAQIVDVNGLGVGTGFLVGGADLHPGLPPTVLLTNAHVVPEALPAGDAAVVFHGLDGDPGVERTFRVVRQWWCEPSAAPDLDVTLLELDGYPADVDPVPVAPSLPKLAPVLGRAYVIGHPAGLEQPQFSLQDNALLDYDDTHLHYRSPTEEGSSGSPVFDGEWRLIGLHRAGGFAVPRLNDRGGTYPANEAVALKAIRERLQIHLPSPEPVRTS